MRAGKSTEMRESRAAEQMREEIEVLRRTVEQNLRAERESRHAKVAKRAGGGRSGESAARDSASPTPVPTSANTWAVLALNIYMAHLTICW